MARTAPSRTVIIGTAVLGAALAAAAGSYAGHPSHSTHLADLLPPPQCVVITAGALGHSDTVTICPPVESG